MIEDMARAVDIFRRRELGETSKDIGTSYGITGVRVNQIYNRLCRMHKLPTWKGLTQEEFFNDLLERASASEEIARIQTKERNVERKIKALSKAAVRRDAMRTSITRAEQAYADAEQAYAQAEIELQAAQDDLAQDSKSRWIKG